MCREFIKVWSCGHEHSSQHDPCRNWLRGNRFCEVTDVKSTIQGLCPECRSSTGSDRGRTRTERAYDSTRGIDRIFQAPSRSPSPPPARHRSSRRSSVFGPSSYIPSPPSVAGSSTSSRSHRSSSRRPSISSTSTSTNPIRSSIRDFMNSMSRRNTNPSPPISPTLRSPPLNYPDSHSRSDSHRRRRRHRSSQALIPSPSSSFSLSSPQNPSSTLTRSSTHSHRSNPRPSGAFTSYRDPSTRSRSPTASRHRHRASISATYAYRERTIDSDGRFRDHGGVIHWNNGSDDDDDSSSSDDGFGFGGRSAGFGGSSGFAGGFGSARMSGMF